MCLLLSQRMKNRHFELDTFETAMIENDSHADVEPTLPVITQGTEETISNNETEWEDLNSDPLPTSTANEPEDQFEFLPSVNQH